MSEEKKLLEKLLVDEQAVLKQIVEKAEKVLRINKHTGTPVILISKDRLSQKDLVGLHIVARYFAFKLGLSSTDAVTIKELKEATDIHNEKLIAARISDLREEGIIEQVRRGEYRASLPNLVRYFEELGERYGQ